MVSLAVFYLKEYEVSDYLRMSGLYWSLTFLDLSGAADKLNRSEVIEFVKRNQHESGGFGPCDGHEPHLLYTLSALQVNSLDAPKNFHIPSASTSSCL